MLLTGCDVSEEAGTERGRGEDDGGTGGGERCCGINVFGTFRESLLIRVASGELDLHRHRWSSCRSPPFPNPSECIFPGNCST